ncbi:hypothetical protein [Georgenia sp. AZ-5]|uniref:hypothetical protein n=1 Tax=Georgenia sp. AZ-5 TaxID=3367526 RepID=UPI00375509BA
MTPLPAEASAAAELADVLTTVLLVVGSVTLALALAAGLVTWWLVRRVRRSRAYRRGTLALRSVAGDRTSRHLARQRLILDRSVEATARVLGGAAAAGRPVGEMSAVADRLAEAARALDAELGLAEREPDPALRRSLSAGLDPRVAEHGRLSAGLRAAVLDARLSVGAVRLRGAADDLAVEAGALEAWGRSYRTSYGAGR